MQSENCNGNPETTVFCHLNEQFAGKGMSQKADDCAGFYGCSSCHQLYDTGHVEGWMVLRAYYRTIRRMLETGVLRV